MHAVSHRRSTQQLGARREVLKVLHSDQRAGRAIQKRLLPSEPLSGAQLHCELGFFPSLLLSGDFVDFFEADRPSRVVCILADVAGHGVSSAMVTVIIKSLINRLRRNLRRSSSFDLLSPARVLERINDELMSTGLGKHATVFVGLFDSEQSRVNYAVAGHSPLPILVDDLGVRVLQGGGRPVGLFDHVDYHEMTESLHGDFYCLISSDGVMDLLLGDRIKEREQGLIEKTQACLGSLASLIDDLKIATESGLPDDVSLLLISGRSRVSLTNRKVVMNAPIGSIGVATIDQRIVVRFDGDVRLSLCTTLDDLIDKLLSDQHAVQILVDLRAASNIDSTCLGLIAKLGIESQKRYGHRPTLICPDGDVLSQVSGLGLMDLFDHQETSVDPTPPVLSIDTQPVKVTG